MTFPSGLPHTLGSLRASDKFQQMRGVKDELRENLICKLEKKETLFPGIVGYEDTVAPQVVNAVLSKHNFILLGLRGQAKTRLIRMLTSLLDEYVPYIAGCEIHDHPFAPICKPCRDAGARARRLYADRLAGARGAVCREAGYAGRYDRRHDRRYRSDQGGAHAASDIGDELTVHYGLLPRANRGIFAINELPDLAGKIQVGLFNIMQEGDVQIKGYPVRLPLDIMLAFTANPEDYTARGKIITPLKDRIGSEIRTHYPATLEHGIEITEQESWTERKSPAELRIPDYIREVIEQIAFSAREDKRVDKRSGVSQRLADFGAGKRDVECGAAGADGG